MPIFSISKTTIFSQPNIHAAFTDLFRHSGKYWLVFRKGERHLSPEGRIIVMESTDAKTWKLNHEFYMPGKDLRDPKLFEWDDTLYVSMVASERTATNHQLGLDTYFSSLEAVPELPGPDNREWTKPKIFLEGLVGWRPKEHDGKLFVPAFFHGSEVPVSLKIGRENRNRIVSKYGKDWALYLAEISMNGEKPKISLVHKGKFVNEADLFWDGNSQPIMLARREYASGLVLSSDSSDGSDGVFGKPKILESRRHLHCPVVLPLPDGNGQVVCWREFWQDEGDPTDWNESLILAVHRGKEYRDGVPDDETVLINGKKTDCGYAGLCWAENGNLLVSYYQGVAGQSGVFLAELKVTDDGVEAGKTE